MLAGIKGTQSFYAVRNQDGKTILMAREILQCDSERVDHENHDTLDNRDGNLRPATPGQNGANQGRHINNTSGYKGVSKAWAELEGASHGQRDQDRYRNIRHSRGRLRGLCLLRACDLG